MGRFVAAWLTFALVAAALLVGCRPGEPIAPASSPPGHASAAAARSDVPTPEKIMKTDEEWRGVLTPEQFRILRKKGTEPAFSSPLNDEKRKGVFVCAGCRLPLYSSEAKYDSGTGWPSFYEPIEPGYVLTKPDNSLFARRTEVLCARCGGHLGHVFEDAHAPTGQRYCMNGLALAFEPDEDEGERTP